MTLPPENATFNAGVRPPFFAACAVRAFAAVATFMPINPANRDTAAPNTKVSASILSSPLFPAAKNKATAAIKGTNALYSRFKKAIAPSEI